MRTLRLRALAPAFLAALLLATPVASALGYGIFHDGLQEARGKGWSPEYTQYWVGAWNKHHGWAGLEAHLREAKAAGATPIVEWYYWASSISPSCVENGCHGKSRADWESLGRALATRVRDVMGDAPVIVVVETEFQINGIERYEPFDGYLEGHIKLLRGIAPQAKYYVGFGAWKPELYPVFDRAVATADGVGFQMMRASTRYTDSWIAYAPDHILDILRSLRRAFPEKPVILHDLALSSYDCREWLQDYVLREIHARVPIYEREGLQAIVFRALRDDPEFRLDEYYGQAERHWGLLRADGGVKPAWWTWRSMAEGRASGPVTLPPFDATYPEVKGNGWWVQAKVCGNQPVSRVEARVNGGAWQALDWQAWGAFAKSIPVPAGATVEFRTTSTTGAQDLSGKYRWPEAAPLPAEPAMFQASWRGVTGNAWWEQVQVSGGSAIRSVDVQVNDGGWRPMTWQAWGGWTSGYHAPPGSRVQFRATDAGGALAWSGFYTWPPA